MDDTTDQLTAIDLAGELLQSLFETTDPAEQQLAIALDRWIVSQLRAQEEQQIDAIREQLERLLDLA